MDQKSNEGTGQYRLVKIDDKLVAQALEPLRERVEKLERERDESEINRLVSLTECKKGRINV